MQLLRQLRAVSEHFQSSFQNCFKAVSKQFQSSFKALFSLLFIDMADDGLRESHWQLDGSSGAISEHFQGRIRAVSMGATSLSISEQFPTHFVFLWSSIRAVSEQFQSRCSRDALKQFSGPVDGIKIEFGFD